MIDPAEKSTEVPPLAEPASGRAEVAPDIFLDGRLGLFHVNEGWLAVSDIHFGYEVSRRAAGGLWPLWGMQSIEARLKELVRDLAPKTLIFTGDIVDSAAAPDEALSWLSRVAELGPDVVLIEGNHDRGRIRRHFDLVPFFRSGSFFFHHGHEYYFEEESQGEPGLVEIAGHRHPSIRFSDGTGTSLRLPTLAMESLPHHSRWILPAFSPWAGGSAYQPSEHCSKFRQWACGQSRVFELYHS